MATLEAYVRHAEQYGGPRDCWEAAVDELGAVELGELAMTLRELSSRQRRAGRKGRTVSVETFRLSRDETAELIGRLIEAGVGDAHVCRFTGASQSMVETIHAELAAHRASRNGTRSATDPPTGTTRAVSAPAAALRSHGSRCCQWCSAPLPATLRGDARYCIGGQCKMAAHRARRAQAA